MNIDLIYRSHTAAFCFAAYLNAGPEATLALLFDSTPPDAPIQELQQQMQDGFIILDEDAPIYQILLSLTLVDIEHKQSKCAVTYLGTGPGEYATTDALLRYDQDQKCWVILQLQSANYIVLRTLTENENGELILSSPCLLDRQEEDLDGLRPLLELDRNQTTHTLLYHKPVLVHTEAAHIHRLGFALRPEWKNLKEQVAVIQQGAETRQALSWRQWVAATSQQQIHYLLPEEVSFDPGDPNTSQSEDLRIQENIVLAAAESAMSLVSQETRLLILCSPESWVLPTEKVRTKEERLNGEEWRIWLTGWERNGATHKWTYAPEIGLPANPDVPAYDEPVRPTVHIAAIAGPITPRQSPTFVVAMAMLKAEEEEQGEVISQAVCLDYDGQVVQVCTSPLGLRPHLCYSGQTVVGVDCFEGGWRLWNWSVLRKNTLDIVIPLNTSCKCAYVHADPVSASFWLVEEQEEGVQASRRDISTLKEIGAVAFLPGVHLQQSMQGSRSLNGYRDVGVIPYQNSLLLLVKEENEVLALYRITD